MSTLLKLPPLNPQAQSILLNKSLGELALPEFIETVIFPKYGYELAQSFRSFVDLHSHGKCHILSYFIVSKLPLDGVLYVSKNTNTLVHSAIVLPSGLIFDATGFRNPEDVFNKYQKICIKELNEHLNKPVRLKPDDFLMELMRAENKERQEALETIFQQELRDLGFKINAIMTFINV